MGFLGWRYLDRFSKVVVIFIVGFSIINVTTLAIATKNSSNSSSDGPIINLKVTGSSTIYPLWVAAQEKILKKFNTKLVIDSTGSGNGVTAAYNKTTDFGNASRNPKRSEVLAAGDKWNNLRTVKLATDAIVMFVKIPAACKWENITTTPDKIVKAYSGLTEEDIIAIANETGDITTSRTNGIINSITRGQTTINVSSVIPKVSDLLSDANGETTTCNQSLVLFTRNTTASGTRDGFLKIANKTLNNNLTWLDEDLFNEFVEARLANSSLKGANEANSSAKQQVLNANSAATYLSFGFASSETTALTSSDREAVPSILFSSENNAVPVIASNENILSNVYQWTRTLNTIIDVTNKNYYSISNILDFFRIDNEGKEIISNEGFIPLSLNSVLRETSYKITDLQIHNLDSTKAIWVANA